MMKRDAGTNVIRSLRLTVVRAALLAILIIPPAIAHAATPAFSVHKNGTAQTVVQDTDVKLTWSTEGFDTNNNFATDRFTPSVAGKYLIVVSAQCMQAGACMPAIYKNGVLIARSQATNVNIGQTPQVTTIVDLNGSTDYVEAFITSAGNVIGGTADRTYFSGTQIDGGGSGGVPAGTITAFAAASCPSGWIEYTAARGRFLRGIDNGAGNDPDGTRTPGNLQTDAVQNATGRVGSQIYDEVNSGAQASGVFEASKVADSTSNAGSGTGMSANDITFDLSRQIRTATETRPKNVAVIFCQYAGGAPLVATPSGAAGAIQYADGSGGLASNPSVVISGGNVGVGVPSPDEKLHVAGHLRLQSTTADATVKASYLVGGHYMNAEEAFGIVGGVAGNGFNSVLIGSAGGAYNAATAIQFFTAANNTTLTGTERVRIDQNGNVGVGTTSPLAKLTVQGASLFGQFHVVGPSANAETAIGFYDVGDSNPDRWVIGKNIGASDDSFVFYKGSERVRITSQGNVGIGTNNPEAKFMVFGGNGAPSLTGDPGIVNFSSDTSVQLTAGVENVTPYAFWLQTKQSTDSGTSFPLALNPLGGNVGIGTTTPGNKLEVSGAVTATGANASSGADRTTLDHPSANVARLLSMGADTATRGSLYFSQTASNGTLYADAMIINSSGNVGIGTMNPKSKLAFANNISDTSLDTYEEYQILLYDSGTAANSYGLAVRSNTLILKSGSTFAFHGTAGTSIATISAAGTYAASDRTLKTDIAPLPYGLADLMKLKPARYRLKEEAEENPESSLHIGLIAQEVQAVVPEVVIGEEGSLQLSYTGLVPVLIKSVQELKADNDNLRATIELHEAEIEGFRRELEALKSAQ